ncbi:MAG: NAD(P)-dependent glycerol-3-phosphate dehydrogenase [Kiritimatiellae bacterium]|nr:NAD(P)-dependent glycerol-3-phosphate dehydrogenase [Kiritimatiellia bacterium]MDD5520932.1 NAD(P)-dependent glycerol-3-phosphate dehydrogenase [Kiritimatiellia bacterium]
MKNSKAKKNICIIGDGGWGTALAIVLHSNGHNVTVWGPFPNYINAIKKTGENKLYLPGIKLPCQLNWTADRKTAGLQADIVILAVPTKFFRSVAESFKGLLPDSCGLLSVAKGFDQKTRKRMTEVAHEILGPLPLAALSGPSHAEEVAARIPTAVTVASKDNDYRNNLQKTFSNSRFRVYTSDDVAGIELGGALKNIIAVAVGVSDGLGFGDNTRAALITRGLAEITRLGHALGAKASTFAGLSGMGDLIVTCTSRHSRNRNVGERLGKGEKLDDILASMKQVAEGIWNCPIARDLAHKAGVEVPITEEVHAIIHKGKSPLDAVESLMSRNVKPE